MISAILSPPHKISTSWSALSVYLKKFICGRLTFNNMKAPPLHLGDALNLYYSIKHYKILIHVKHPMNQYFILLLDALKGLELNTQFA